jgi:hypothetical protein
MQVWPAPRSAGNHARHIGAIPAAIDDDVVVDGARQVAGREIDTMSTLVNQSFRNYNTGDMNAADSMRTLAGSASSASSVLNRLSGI